ncbi:hypothetical protein MTO96_010083 [Rhipicephalus appendiculatus]
MASPTKLFHFQALRLLTFGTVRELIPRILPCRADGATPRGTIVRRPLRSLLETSTDCCFCLAHPYRSLLSLAAVVNDSRKSSSSLASPASQRPQLAEGSPPTMTTTARIAKPVTSAVRAPQESPQMPSRKGLPGGTYTYAGED